MVSAKNRDDMIALTKLKMMYRNTSARMTASSDLYFRVIRRKRTAWRQRQRTQKHHSIMKIAMGQGTIPEPLLRPSIPSPRKATQTAAVCT